MRDIPVETLRALLRLNPETGTLYWRERGVEWFRDGKQTATHASRRWNSRNSGREVPASPANGYLRVCVLKTLMRYHRVVFAMHHGRWPAAHVDHKDGNSLNNRPANLREATNQENSRNSRPRRGTSPFKGVSWSTSRERWVAHCRSRSGRSTNLGEFSSEEAAARAYDRAAAKWHGEFARLNFPEEVAA